MLPIFYPYLIIKRNLACTLLLSVIYQQCVKINPDNLFISINHLVWPFVHIID